MNFAGLRVKALKLFAVKQKDAAMDYSSLHP